MEHIYHGDRKIAEKEDEDYRQEVTFLLEDREENFLFEEQTCIHGNPLAYPCPDCAVERLAHGTKRNEEKIPLRRLDESHAKSASYLSEMEDAEDTQ